MSRTVTDEDRRKLAAAHMEAEEARYSARVGDGAVTVEVNGLQEVVSVEISPKAMALGDPKPLAELVKRAVNEANKKSTRALYDALEELSPAIGLDLEALRKGDP